MFDMDHNRVIAKFSFVVVIYSAHAVWSLALYCHLRPPLRVGPKWHYRANNQTARAENNNIDLKLNAITIIIHTEHSNQLFF